MMLCFPSGRKKGKVAGSQRLTSLELCHFHPGNVFVPIPQVEKLSGLCMEAIFSIWLLFEQFMPWSPGLAFSYSHRSHRGTTPAKSKEFQLFRTGPGYVQHSAKLRGSTPLCSLFCVCCRDPLRTVKSTSSKTPSLLNKEGLLLKEVYSGRHTPLRLHEREWRAGHVWWEPRSMAAWSRVVNAALEDPGAGCGRDKSESGWLCGR